MKPGVLSFKRWAGVESVHRLYLDLADALHELVVAHLSVAVDVQHHPEVGAAPIGQPGLWLVTGWSLVGH